VKHPFPTNQRFGRGSVCPTAFTCILLTSALALTSAPLAGQARRQTSEEKTLNRLQTLCDDSIRAVSYWNRTSECWETTLQPAARAR
jgi:hypothetical protein